jgi:chitinase
VIPAGAVVESLPVGLEPPVVYICPTGFTTITTTITKTYCPGDSSATATPTGTAEHGSSPAFRNGSSESGRARSRSSDLSGASWGGSSLTKPAATTTSEVVSQPTAPSVPEGYTTTVTVCNSG